MSMVLVEKCMLPSLQAKICQKTNPQNVFGRIENANSEE